MKTAIILLLASICVCLPVRAQDTDNAADRTAIETLGKTWQDTWNRHDMDALSLLLTEDVDFVSVLGPKGWLKGRQQWLAVRAKMHKTYFTESVWTTREAHIKFLRPDLAIAHVLWSTTGDKVRHVKHGEPREGIFTWVVEKRSGTWLIVASQNTETMPVLPGQ
jgi:uncharacterized protein (TIGR02246 family)